MPSRLHDLILRHIGRHGPISVAAYMDLCLNHPEFGYYRSRDPLGLSGDFITAPEVSQLFGEMIGICIADMVMRMANPPEIILCELGPGRGTLMKDMLRVLSRLPGLKVAAHLVETSEVLKNSQKDLLKEATWHRSIDTVPDHLPVIFIGNEFLDALPFRQIEKTPEGWRERMVCVQDENLVFGLGGAVPGIDIAEGKDGDVFEFSPIRENIWSDICHRVNAQKGAALMMDYGHLETRTGGTFQAVKNHAYTKVLENAGEADLTSHVDFARLKQLANGIDVEYYTTQGEFLRNIGIEVRAEKLSAANPDLRGDIMAGLKRLIDPVEMGDLFKVIGISKCT